MPSRDRPKGDSPGQRLPKGPAPRLASQNEALTPPDNALLSSQLPDPAAAAARTWPTTTHQGQQQADGGTGPPLSAVRGTWPPRGTLGTPPPVCETFPTVGVLSPSMYSNLPPVNFASHPVNLAVLSSPSNGPLSTASPFAHGRQPSSTHPEYSDEEEPESSSGLDSSCGGFKPFHARKSPEKTAAASSDRSSGGSDGDEDEWGPVRSSNFKMLMGSSGSSDEEGMFIPEPVMQLDHCRQKPLLPYLSKEELKVGSPVWVVDEEDVDTLLKNHFSRSYEMVCNGRKRGTVMRHNGDMTMVSFNDADTGVRCCLTMPRACLSLKPIEPYESGAGRTSTRVLGSYYCNVGPKATGSSRKRDERTAGNVCQQYYEDMAALAIPKESIGDLAEAQSLFQAGHFDEALAIVNRILPRARAEVDAATGKGGAAAAAAEHQPGTRSPVAFLVDVLVMRSRILLFQGRYVEALVDAELCVALEPKWVRGHLSVARAQSALGGWTQATSSLRAAEALLPASNELDRIAKMTKYLVSIQRRLDSTGHRVLIRLDQMYRKRLVPTVAHAAGDVLCAEVTPILAVTPMLCDHPPGLCSVCFRSGAERMEMVTSTRTNPIACTSPHAENDLAEESDGHHPPPLERQVRPVASPDRRASAAAPLPSGHTGSSPTSTTSGSAPPALAYFCSTDCQQRASLYSQLEAKHQEQLDRAKDFIHTRAAVTAEHRPLEIAAMTLRLFYMVVSTHKRLTALQHSYARATSGAQSASSRADPCAMLDSSKPIDLNAAVMLGWSSPASTTLPVSSALRHLGLYPLANDMLSPRGREELDLLHATLTADFKEESKKIYTSDLFCNLYNYVNTYVSRVDLPPPGPAAARTTKTPVSAELKGLVNTDRVATWALFLPWLVGCTRRAPLAHPQSMDAAGSGAPSAGADSGGDIPDSIGPHSVFSIEALLQTDGEAEAQRRVCGAAASSPGLAAAKESNCCVVMASASSKAQPVACVTDDSCDAPVSPIMPAGLLLELATVRPVSEGEALWSVPLAP